MEQRLREDGADLVIRAPTREREGTDTVTIFETFWHTQTTVQYNSKQRHSHMRAYCTRKYTKAKNRNHETEDRRPIPYPSLSFARRIPIVP